MGGGDKGATRADIYVTFRLVLPKLLKGCKCHLCVCACVLRLKGSSTKPGMFEQVIIELTFGLGQGLAA